MRRVNHFGVLLLAVTVKIRFARVRRLGESFATAFSLLIYSVDARSGEARVAFRVSEAGTSSGSVPGITGPSETVVLSYDGVDQKVSLMFSQVPCAASRNAAVTFSWIFSISLGNILPTALRLGANTVPFAEAVDGCSSDADALV